jgi:hypothetical protein
MVGRGVAPASALTHARILMKANQGEAGPGRIDAAIGAALEVIPTTVARVRMRYVAAGLDAAEYRKPPRASTAAGWTGAGGTTGGADLQRPPQGYKRWTLRLLADQLVELQVVESVSYETVRQALKQTGSSRGWPSAGASHPSRTRNSSGEWRTCLASPSAPMIRAARRSAWTRPAASPSPRSVRPAFNS